MAHRGGALVLGTRRSSLPIFPRPSHDNQLMSRLATTITMLVMSTAKQENSRRSLTRKRISRLPFASLCSIHVDTSRHCTSFDARLTKHHELFQALCFPAAKRVSGTC